nr:MAG TPA: hypothetical protein [Caudoviricetes sp.]
MLIGGTFCLYQIQQHPSITGSFEMRCSAARFPYAGKSLWR